MRRQRLALAAAALGGCLVVLGIALWYLPAGVAAAGAAVLAAVTFDPARVGRITWPR